MDAGRRSRSGEIAALLRLIDDHAAAIEYDFRVRFGFPLRDVFAGDVTWREAWSLVAELRRDPTSHLAAELAGWDYPLSREGLTLADTYDAFVQANTDKKRRSMIKPYPRPFQPVERTKSKRPTVTQETVRRALAARGH